MVRLLRRAPSPFGLEDRRAAPVGGRRPSRIEDCLDEAEFVVEATRRDDFEDLGASDLASEAIGARVFAEEPEGPHASITLGSDPTGERSSGRDEDREVVSRVEVFAFPIHLVGNEWSISASS